MKNKVLYVTRDKKPDDNYGNEYCLWLDESGGGKGPVIDKKGLWGEGHDDIRIIDGFPYSLLLPQIKAMKLPKGGIKKVRLELVVEEKK